MRGTNINDPSENINNLANLANNDIYLWQIYIITFFSAMLK